LLQRKNTAEALGDAAQLDVDCSFIRHG
jgi:hypothetical protein